MLMNIKATAGSRQLYDTQDPRTRNVAQPPEKECVAKLPLKRNVELSHLGKGMWQLSRLRQGM